MISMLRKLTLEQQKYFRESDGSRHGLRKCEGQSAVGANGSQCPDGRMRAMDKSQRKSLFTSRHRVNILTIRGSLH